MRIKVTDDLTLETWPSGGAGDPAYVALTRATQQRDNPEAGIVVIYSGDVKPLVAGLVEAAVALVEEETSDAKANR